MPISNAYRALAAAASVGLLAGCSGESQLAPSGNNARAQSATSSLLSKAMKPEARLFASAKAELARELRGPVANTNGHWMSFGQPDNTKRVKFDFVVTNDGNFGNVDLYDESTGVMVAQCAGCGGWGLATNYATSGSLASGDIAYGTFSGTVVLAHVSGVSPYVTPYSTVLTSGNGAAGIAFDSNGNLYASDFGTNCWDSYTAAAAGSSGPSSGVTCNSDFSLVYYLATSGTKLYVDGYDIGYLFAIGTATAELQQVQLTLKGVNSGLCASGAEAVPGGIAITGNAAARMSVNNQYGCVTEYKPPYTANAFHHFSWTFDPNDYVGIGYGKSQSHHLWGADYNFEGSPSEGYATEWTLRGAVIKNTTPIQSGELPLGLTTTHGG
jgi:hypothetical protein